MKTKWTKLITVYLVYGQVFVLSCSGQNTVNNVAQNKPDVKITVNKRMDKNGTIISYDSVYSYSCTAEGRKNSDTVMATMPYFYKGFGNASFLISFDSILKRHDLRIPIDWNRQFEWHQQMFEQMHKRQEEWKQNIFYEHPKNSAEKMI